MSPMVLDRVEDSPADPPRLEKRGKGRLRLGCFIRVRPSVPGSKSVSEVLKTLNVSRNGLYFGTISSFYFKGMRLFVTYSHCRGSQQGLRRRGNASRSAPEWPLWCRDPFLDDPPPRDEH